MKLFFFGTIILFFSGIISNLFGNKHKVQALIFMCAVGLMLCSVPLYSVFQGNILQETFCFNEIFGSATFVIDKLSAFFILLISVMSFLPLLYSKGYLKPYIESGKRISSHLVFLPVLIASMLMVVTCANALCFLIFWEIMSLSSFFLVIFENEKKEVRRSGIKYLVFMHISVIFIMLSFILMSVKSGSYNFADFQNALKDTRFFADLVFILSFVGFGTKAGFVPFHNWLPSAHPMAPSHVSAIMSGVMIKTGIYGILRMLILCGAQTKIVAYTVLIISVISGLYGVLYAIAQHDIKKLLAYHSIENIGIIGTGIGIGMLGLAYNNNAVAALGFLGAIIHVLNHSIFKELLFLAAGNVYLKTHTKQIEALGGLIKPMKKTALLFLTGSVAICGLLPFCGFISEFLIYYGAFKGLNINSFFALTVMLFAIAGLALIGTMAILCFTKAFSVIFLGAPRSDFSKKVQDDCVPSMIYTGAILGVLTLLIGVFPKIVIPIAASAASLLIPVFDYSLLKEPVELLQTISVYAGSFLVFIVILTLIKMLLTKGKISYHQTWVCGYDKPSSKMQYTASSYASPFLAMLRPLFKKIFDIEKPKHLFPKKAHFSLDIEDVEEAYLINPIIKLDEKFLSKFETMQSGNIQSYIKYGLVFLAAVVIGSFLI